MAETYLRIGIDGTQAQSGSRVVTRSLEDIARSAQAATDSTGKLESASQYLARTYDSLKSSVSAAAAAFASWKLTQVIQETTLFAANIEQATRALQVIGNATGHTGDEMLRMRDRLKDANITTSASTNAVAQMARAHLDLDKALPLARMAQGAAIMASMTGETVSSSEALDRMIHGIITGNVVQLHQLGIMVNQRDALRENKEATGEASTAVDAHQRHVLLLNAVLQQGGNLMDLYAQSSDLAAKKIASSKRPFEELKLALGQLFLPELSASASAFYDVVSGGMHWVKSHTDELQAGKEMIKGFAEGLVYGTAVVGAYSATVALASVATGGFAAGAGVFASTLKLLNTQLSLTGVEALTASTRVGLMGESIATSSTVATLALSSVKVAFSVLGAFMVGWEIGKTLSEQFETVRKGGVYAVYGLMAAWNELKFTVREFWAVLSNPTGTNWTAAISKIEEERKAWRTQHADMMKEQLADQSKTPGLSTADKAFKDNQAAILKGKQDAAAMLAEEQRRAGESAAKEAEQAAERARQSYNQGLQAYNRLVAEYEKGNTVFDETEKKIIAVSEAVRLLSKEHPEFAKDARSVGNQIIEQITDDSIYQQSQKAMADRTKSEGAAASLYFANRMAFYDNWIATENAGAAKFLRAQANNEARIKRQLFGIDMAQVTYSIGTDDALSQRKKLYDDLLDVQQRVLSGISKGGDPSGWNSQMAAIDQTRMKLIELQKTMQDRTAYGGAIAALHDYAEAAMNTGDQVKNAIAGSLKGLEDSLVNLVTKMKLDFRSLADSIESDLARMAIKQGITGPLSSGMSSAMSMSGIGAAAGDAYLPGALGVGGTAAAAASGAAMLAGGLAILAVGMPILSAIFDDTSSAAERAANALRAALKALDDQLAVRDYAANGNQYQADLLALHSKQTNEINNLVNQIISVPTNNNNHNPTATINGTPIDINNLQKFYDPNMPIDPSKPSGTPNSVTPIQYQLDPTYQLLIKTQQDELKQIQDKYKSQFDTFTNGLFDPMIQAQRDLSDATKTVQDTFTSLGLTLPTTRDGIANLVAGLDRTSDAFSKIMSIGTSLNVVLADMDTSINQAAIDFGNNLQERLNTAQGLTYTEQLYKLQIDQENQLTDARKKGMDVTKLMATQQQESAKAIADIFKQATTDTISIQTNLLQGLTGIIQSRLTPLQKYQQDQAIYDNTKALAEQGNKQALTDIVTRANDLLASSSAYNGTNAQYMSDYNNVVATLSSLAGLSTTSPTLEATQNQLTTLQAIQTAMNEGNKTQLEYLKGLLNNTGLVAQYLGGYLANIPGAGGQTAAQAITALNFPSFDVGSAGLASNMLAQVHKGEIILDANSSGILQRYGIQVHTPDNYQAPMNVDGLNATNRILSNMEKYLDSIDKNTAAGAKYAEAGVRVMQSGLSQSIEIQTRHAADTAEIKRFTRLGANK